VIAGRIELYSDRSSTLAQGLEHFPISLAPSIYHRPA